MILAADIGGTKTHLALFERVGDTLKIRHEKQYVSRDFTTLNEVISAFANAHTFSNIEAACFGIAGPIVEGNCRTTNLPWDITKQDLQKDLGIDNVRLINDLEATAYGMLYLEDEDFFNLNPAGRNIKGNHAVIAAGTGLGEAILYYDGENYHPIGSEGGHSDFAPLTPQQDKLLSWMRHRFPGHVSFERVLSGPGVYTLYEFLAQSGFAPQPSLIVDASDDVDKSALVSECALTHNDPLCLETLRLFCEIYGAEAGNLALKSMSLGGVYVGGGIAPKILPMLKKHFMEGFTSKGRFEEMLHGVEVKVSLNPQTALIGAAYFGATRL